ncbi:MAG: hypothetical protein U9Q03_04550 [Patescibacteria group bacterium]|nr:hypothetical protein [Patescibacteria group bacterium]
MTINFIAKKKQVPDWLTRAGNEAYGTVCAIFALFTYLLAVFFGGLWLVEPMQRAFGPAGAFLAMLTPYLILGTAIVIKLRRDIKESVRELIRDLVKVDWGEVVVNIFKYVGIIICVIVAIPLAILLLFLLSRVHISGTVVIAMLLLFVIMQISALGSALDSAPRRNDVWYD